MHTVTPLLAWPKGSAFQLKRIRKKKKRGNNWPSTSLGPLGADVPIDLAQNFVKFIDETDI